MKYIAIIPARYDSSRFPGKPLANINGKPMIQRVYEQVKQSIDQVVVATDDRRIVDAVEKFGGNVVMTSTTHQSGTDRIAEAAKLCEKEFDFDVVVNVQGDEPFIEPEQIELIKSCFQNAAISIATLMSEIHSTEILFDPNKVKVVASNNGNALYFSRTAIPFQRDVEQNQWLNNQKYYLHIGMYAFKKDVLQTVCKIEQSPMELSEKLEQLRWLENGYSIGVAKSHHSSFGIDTPEDLERAIQMDLI